MILFSNASLCPWCSGCSNSRPSAGPQTPPCLLLITWIGCVWPTRSLIGRLHRKHVGHRPTRPGTDPPLTWGGPTSSFNYSAFRIIALHFPRKSSLNCESCFVVFFVSLCVTTVRYSHLWFRGQFFFCCHSRGKGNPKQKYSIFSFCFQKRHGSVEEPAHSQSCYSTVVDATKGIFVTVIWATRWCDEFHN